ncbi:unnamed protein product [Moneuplotes crassus]|uniref:Uncharacterized protein n=1 Tax=Euplotes crassus TaxID=5936 RepID=A0AAD1XE49_EUPCR|nr:unnamed protein product [Moneuplotes crassus]
MNKDEGQFYQALEQIESFHEKVIKTKKNKKKLSRLFKNRLSVNQTSMKKSINLDLSLGKNNLLENPFLKNFPTKARDILIKTPSQDLLSNKSKVKKRKRKNTEIFTKAKSVAKYSKNRLKYLKQKYLHGNQSFELKINPKINIKRVTKERNRPLSSYVSVKERHFISHSGERPAFDSFLLAEKKAHSRSFNKTHSRRPLSGFQFRDQKPKFLKITNSKELLGDQLSKFLIFKNGKLRRKKRLSRKKLRKKLCLHAPITPIFTQMPKRKNRNSSSMYVFTKSHESILQVK